MTLFRRLLCTIAFAAACAACGLLKPAPIVPPTPTPTPIPTPTPAPTPVGHVVTASEYAALALGATEADVIGRWGSPIKKTPLGPGVTALIYSSSDDLIVEVWIRAGRVVNRNRF